MSHRSANTVDTRLQRLSNVEMRIRAASRMRLWEGGWARNGERSERGLSSAMGVGGGVTESRGMGPPYQVVDN